MGIFSFPTAFTLLLASTLGVQANTAHQPSPETHLVLRAATKGADLLKRSIKIEQKFETELVYTDGEKAWGNGESVFASTLKVASKRPILNLEEIEHHLADVHCGDGNMRLAFADASSAADARMACHGSDGGLVITSHSGCNKDGERAVYKVHESSFSEDGAALELSVVRSLWERAFDRFEVGWSQTEEEHFYRRHSDFADMRRRKRQADTPASKTIQRIEIPTDTPENVNQVEFNLGKTIKNKTFDPNEFTAGLPPAFNPLPDLSNMPVEIGCELCETKGRLVVSQGAININVTEIDLIPDFLPGQEEDQKDIASVITGGFMELQANGMGAHLGLFARTKKTGSFEITFLALPILGFTIPGVGNAGATFEAAIAADFTINGGFEMTYGMDVEVPDNSTIRVELTDIANSGVKGFVDTKVTPLPFKLEQTEIDNAFVSLALIPSVPIGFNFSDTLDASVEVSMDLPRIDAEISALDNVDTQCRPGQAAQLGSMLLIESNLSLTVDVGFELKLPLLPPPLDGASTSAQIFSTMFPLPTQCLDPGAGFAPGSGANGSAPIATGIPASGTGTVCSTTTLYVPPSGTPGAPYGNGTTPTVPPVASNTAPGNGVPPPEFTGAAPILTLPVSWQSSYVGWQLAALSASILFGALML